MQSDLGAPSEVKEALRRACYDCHSNQTRWPWYSRVAPLSTLIQSDVIEGRKRLNFSKWSAYADDPGTLAEKLNKIGKQVANGDMAPWYYRLVHPEARLDRSEREAILRWAAQAAAQSPAK